MGAVGCTVGWAAPRRILSFSEKSNCCSCLGSSGPVCSERKVSSLLFLLVISEDGRVVRVVLLMVLSELTGCTRPRGREEARDREEGEDSTRRSCLC